MVYDNKLFFELLLSQIEDFIMEMRNFELFKNVMEKERDLAYNFETMKTITTEWKNEVFRQFNLD